MNALRKLGERLKAAAVACADPLTIRERWVVLWIVLLLVGGTAIKHFRTAPVVRRDTDRPEPATATVSDDLPEPDPEATK